jgi:hypothetical protein
MNFSLVVLGANNSSAISFPAVNTGRLNPEAKITAWVEEDDSHLSNAEESSRHNARFIEFTGSLRIVMIEMDPRVSKDTNIYKGKYVSKGIFMLKDRLLTREFLYVFLKMIWIICCHLRIQE